MSGTAAVITRLSDAAQHRGGRTQRRIDGAYFTDADVAQHLARRAIGARLLAAAGLDAASIDALLAEGGDPTAVVRDRCARAATVRQAVLELLGALVVLDPTCGAGSFLVAAWRELRAIEQALDVHGIVSGSQLHGCDIDAGAVAACRETLALVLRDDDRPSVGLPQITLADAQVAGVLPAADVVLGNPPFVRATARLEAAVGDLRSAPVPNRSAWIVERSLLAARPGARVSFVLPISTMCTDAFASARAVWADACESIHASHFDTIPASLFPGVVQRLTLVEGRRREGTHRTPTRWWTTRYHRWTGAERAGLLERIRHVALTDGDAGIDVRGSLPKVGSTLELGLLERIHRFDPARRWFVRGAAADGGNRLRYKRRWSYFLLFTDFVPAKWDAGGALVEPTEFKSLDIDGSIDARVLLALYSSTLFWWYFSVYTDNRNVNRRDLGAFPVPELARSTQDRLTSLADELMVALRACAQVRTCTYESVGTIRNTYFRQGATRPVLDRIDAVLADAYGMTDDELAFVLGFERRFRGGELSAAVR